jgi:hypothetical protein
LVTEGESQAIFSAAARGTAALTAARSDELAGGPRIGVVFHNKNQR